MIVVLRLVAHALQIFYVMVRKFTHNARFILAVGHIDFDNDFSFYLFSDAGLVLDFHQVPQV